MDTADRGENSPPPHSVELSLAPRQWKGVQLVGQPDPTNSRVSALEGVLPHVDTSRVEFTETLRAGEGGPEHVRACVRHTDGRARRRCRHCRGTHGPPGCKITTPA